MVLKEKEELVKLEEENVVVVEKEDFCGEGVIWISLEEVVVLE